MILEKIAEDTRIRVAVCKEKISFREMKEKAEELARSELMENQLVQNDPVSNSLTSGEPAEGKFAYPFEQALRQSDISFICEVKKASPSKGIIAEEFDYLAIAKDYERAGAAAISVLTEPKYFLGDNSYLTEIANEVSVPLLRKDFVVDAYQIYEAKVIGASAVLLICEITEEGKLKEYLNIAHEIGLSVLVEAHTPEQIDKAVRSGARIIGVNNRNLKDFHVDVDTTKQLRHLVPEDVLFVSESGIKTPEDIERLREAKADAVLIGETLMKSADKKETIAWLKGKVFNGKN